MGSIYSVFEVPGSASQLVIGTEFKWLLICNESGGEFIHQVECLLNSFNYLKCHSS
jgi:hypothetical protein